MSEQKKTKYIFVVGGVMSGVGKGVTSASIGVLLQAKGLKVTAVKVDPYINVDAGTMNPTEHGEVFVLDDGDETDQDMGNYERFLNQSFTRTNYMTTGRVYLSVIERERNLEYDGKNVEVIPDIPLEIIRRIKKSAKGFDVVITEIGGTVGEYQGVLFLEAIRHMKYVMEEDVAVVMVSYLPTPKTIGEMKTKPTQTASRTLNSAGLQADVIIARAATPLDDKRREKIANLCSVRRENIISAPDVDSIYDIPLNFEKTGLADSLCNLLKMDECSPNTDLSAWQAFVDKVHRAPEQKHVKIAVVGKYFSSGDFILSDVYISVLEAIKFSAYDLGVYPEIHYLSSQDFEGNGSDLSRLDDFDGILVPGGFGKTGVEGILNVICYAREQKIPYFGICYGMQLMLAEYGRNVLGWEDAHTVEVDKNTKHPVVVIMETQKEILEQGNYGGTMRLGKYPAVLKDNTLAMSAYKTDEISERHRHRYEINPQFIPDFEKAGVIFSGTSPDGSLMEIAELKTDDHPFMVGVQFHPELKARPLSPHPLFTAFIKACL